MSYLLHIDTAVVSASVCISKDEEILGELINPNQRDHAAWIQNAISKLAADTGISLHQLDAISVSAGPGSYTGLRVGLATAKGLCYALRKPLIMINTLKMMTGAVENPGKYLLCPMIDARRMEVFTAIYKANGEEVLPPCNIILDSRTFTTYFHLENVIFFGNGSEKFKQIIDHPNAIFVDVEATAKQLVPLAFSEFNIKNFADLAYAEPNYGKEFYSPGVKPSL